MQREVEMQAAARANKIGKERWTSSRIFRMWKSQCARQQRKGRYQLEDGSKKCEINGSDHMGEIFLRVTPEVSLQNSNSSCTFFRWKPWLTTCICSYYNTGNLRIPNECTGDDILLTLEYFGILTASPDDFLFDSSDAYNRIQAWSRYFMHRTVLAESLLDAYDDVEIGEGDQNRRSLTRTAHLRATLVWVLLKEKENDMKNRFDVIGDNISHAKTEMETSLDHNSETTRVLRVREAGGLYDLFFGMEDEKRVVKREYIMGEQCEGGKATNTLSKELSSRMRQDFCAHLKQSLPPWISVRFDIERVEVKPICSIKEDKFSKATIESRPVIRICHDQLQSAGNQYRKHDTGSRQSFDTVDAVNKLQPNEIDIFHESQQICKPIKYVNMEFGDLRSVTSALSEPIEDDRRGFNRIHTARRVSGHKNKKKMCPGGSRVQVTAKEIVQERSGRIIQDSSRVEVLQSKTSPLPFNPVRIPQTEFERKIETPPRATRNIRTTPPWDLDRNLNIVDEKMNFKSSKATKKAIVGKVDDSSRELPVKHSGSIAGSDTITFDDTNSDAKSKTGQPDLHGSWGHLLATICEAMIPAPSSNVLSLSPVRHFEMGSSKSKSSSVASSDYDDQIYSGNDNIKVKSELNGFVDQAKRMGNDLSNQLDELMKMAYNEKDQEGVYLNGHQSLSPIMEEIPDILSIDKDEDLTLTSCLTSSVMGQPHKNRISEEFGETQKVNSKCLSEKMNNSMVYAIPKSKSSSVAIPRCIDKGKGSGLAQHKQAGARKKGKARDFSMRNCASKVEKRFKDSETNGSFSVSRTTSRINTNDYSKENRYSPQENRFYS